MSAASSGSKSPARRRRSALSPAERRGLFGRLRLQPAERAAWSRWFREALRDRGVVGALARADRMVRAHLRGDMRALLPSERQLSIFDRIGAA